MVADMPKAGPPPRVLAPEIAILTAPEIAAEAKAMLSLKRNDSMVFSESTRTERASESDGSERSEHEGSDDDDASQVRRVTGGGQRVTGGGRRVTEGRRGGRGPATLLNRPRVPAARLPARHSTISVSTN